MITLKQEPKVGALYKFVYKDKARVALVLDDSNGLMTAYDFVREDFRKFYHDKMGVVEDISSKVKVFNDYEYDVNELESAGCTVFEDYDNDKLYAVRLKQKETC